MKYISFFVGLSLLAMPFAPAYADTISETITTINPGTEVTVGTTVTFYVAYTGLVIPSYSVTDSFPDSSITANDIDENGNFSWTPTASDIGSHRLAVTVKDDNNNSATLIEYITVAAVGSVFVQSISPGTSVAAGEPLSFTVQSYGFTNPFYTITDNFSGSSVNNNDMGQNGYFLWTPTASDIGTHDMTVHVSDSDGHIGSVQEQITVTTASPPPINTSPSNPSTPSSPATNPSFTETLSVDSTGPEVTALQQRLTSDGDYTGPITGYYGTLTEAAVEKYQTAHNVSPAGVVGPQTRALLNVGL